MSSKDPNFSQGLQSFLELVKRATSTGVAQDCKKSEKSAHDHHQGERKSAQDYVRATVVCEDVMQLRKIRDVMTCAEMVNRMRNHAGHSSWVTSVSWSSDGKICSGSKDETVRVWEVSSSNAIGNALCINCATIIAIITSYVPRADLLCTLMDKSGQDSNPKSIASDINQASFDNGTCKTLVTEHGLHNGVQMGGCAEQTSSPGGLIEQMKTCEPSRVATSKSPELSVFPLSSALDKWQLVKDRLGKGKDQEAENSIRGTQAALSALRDIYQFSCPEWEAVREKVRVGLLDSTGDCGDDSAVSMALAVRYFSNPTYSSSSRVSFLNCSDSGMKLQMYTNSQPITLAAQLETGFSPVGLLSIGHQKSRFTVGGCELGPNNCIDDLPGMNNGVLAVGPRLVKHLSKLDLATAVQRVIDRNQIPVIVLAGGGLSLLESDESLRARLLQPVVLPSEPLRTVSLSLAPFDQRRLEILESVRQLDKFPNFKWNKPYLIPRLTFSSPSSSSATPLPLVVNLPITLARLCALAAICLQKPTTNYLRVFSAQELNEGEDSTNGCVRLIELKQDSDMENLKGDEVLYFFTEEEELLDRDEIMEARVKKGLFAPPVFNSNRLWDTIKEYLIRAQHLFPHDTAVVQQAVTNKFGVTTKRVQEMVSDLAKTPEEITRIFKPYDNSHILASLTNSSPPIPPHTLPSLHSLHQSGFQKLPLGMYKGSASSFYDAVSQELNAINKISSNITAEDVQAAIELELGHPVGYIDTVNHIVECEILAKIYCHITVHVVEPHPCRIKSFGSGPSHMWLFYHCSTWFPLWSPPDSSSPPLLTLLAPIFIQTPNLTSMKTFAQEWTRIRVDREIFKEVKYTMSEIAHATFLEAFDGCTCDICKSLCIRWTQRLEEVLDFGKAQDYKETVCLVFGPYFVAHLKLLDLAESEKAHYESVLRDFFALLRTNMTKENYNITFLADEAIFLSSCEDTQPLALNSLITSFVPIPAPASMLNEEILLASLTLELPLGLHSGEMQLSLVDCVAEQLQVLGIAPASCMSSHDANSVHGDILYFYAKHSQYEISRVSNGPNEREHMSECESVYSWREAVVALARIYRVSVYVAQNCAGTNKPVFAVGGSNSSRDAIWLFKNKLNEWSSLWSTPIQQYSKQKRHSSKDQLPL